MLVFTDDSDMIRGLYSLELKQLLDRVAHGRFKLPAIPVKQELSSLFLIEDLQVANPPVGIFNDAFQDSPIMSQHPADSLGLEHIPIVFHDALQPIPSNCFGGGKLKLVDGHNQVEHRPRGIKKH